MTLSAAGVALVNFQLFLLIQSIW